MLSRKVGCVKNVIDTGIKLSDFQFIKEILNQIKVVWILKIYHLPLINVTNQLKINEVYLRL